MDMNNCGMAKSLIRKPYLLYKVCDMLSRSRALAK